MLDFKKMLHSNSGKVIISIILGLGLASLFRKACSDRKCLKFTGPPEDKVKEIASSTYKYNDKCYNFVPSATTCDSKKKQVRFSEPNKE